MIHFMLRNLKVFYKDKSSVFFSMLAVLIIIVLYFAFLGDSLSSAYEGVEGMDGIMDNWISAGLLAVASLTSTMGAFGVMVEDRARRLAKDFYSSPLKRRDIAGGYVLSAFLVGVIMSLVTLIVTQLYILLSGGAMLNGGTLLKVLGLILICSASNTAFVLLIVSFFSSQGAFTGASTLIGTFIGFVAGIYMPVGVLPEGVRFIVKLFPVSHGAALMRRTVMQDSLAEAFRGAPEGALEEFNIMMGNSLIFGENAVPAAVSISFLLGSGALFFLLALLNIRRKGKNF